MSSIEINKWDKVWVNDYLLKISSKEKTEIKVNLNIKEVKKIKVWTKVKIKHYDKKYNGIVYSRSNKIDLNGNYYVIIVLDKVVKFSWSFVKVEFIIDTNKTLFPLEYIKITWKKTWIIGILDTKSNKEKMLKVLIWKASGSFIEINWILNKNWNISSLSNNVEIVIK